MRRTRSPAPSSVISTSRAAVWTVSPSWPRAKSRSP